ncbi:MAG: alpha/beta fold hydrolase [Candidatus Lokiarchaeota archaeon]|nr:alpha/beta fold hydrolase [Candidatus Lokiarchaeota archaeon]
MKINKKFIVLIISLILIIIGIGPMIYFTYFAGNYSRTDVNLTSDDGTTITSWLYVPNPPPSSGNPVPAVVVTHGFTSSKVSMQGYSIEFVKRGFVVIAIDYRGHGSSGGYLDNRRYTNESPLIDDLMAAVRFLQTRNYVDNKSIAIMGHSMGGITAIQAAGKYPDEINATISIGAILDPNHGEGTVNCSQISNFMIGIGQLEELFTIEDALAFMENQLNLTNPQVGVEYGNFSVGNARKLVVSPYADHILEMNDKVLIEASIEWLEDSFYGSIQSPISITESIRSIFFLIAALGILLGYLPIVVYSRKFIFKSKPLIRDIRDTLKVKPQLNIKPCKDIKEKIITSASYSLIYILGTGIGLLLQFPLSYIFESTIPKSMANLFLAIFFGFSIGIFISYILIKRFIKKDRTQFYRILINRLKRNLKKSILLGLLVFLYVFASLSILLQIGYLDVILGIREIGVFLAMAALISPYFIIDEMFIRQLQDRVNIKNKYLDWISITILGSISKIAVLIPLLFLNLGFSGLIVAILIIFLPVLQFLTTWLYIHSDINPITPMVLSLLFVAWFLTFLMPFGTGFFSLL